MTMPENDIPLSREERKRKLLAEGALYRIGIIESRAIVHTNLTPGNLAKGVFERVVGGAYSTVSNLFSGNRRYNLESLSPLLIGAFTILTKRYLRKPLLYTGVVSGVVGLVLYFSDNKKRPVAEKKPILLVSDKE